MGHTQPTREIATNSPAPLRSTEHFCIIKQLNSFIVLLSLVSASASSTASSCFLPKRGFYNRLHSSCPASYSRQSGRWRCCSGTFSNAPESTFELKGEWVVKYHFSNVKRGGLNQVTGLGSTQKEQKKQSLNKGSLPHYYPFLSKHFYSQLAACLIMRLLPLIHASKVAFSRCRLEATGPDYFA